MKVDERFMTILTALFVIVGVGAVMQRGENGTSLLGGGGTFEPRPDSFAVRAGRTQPLDVLLNDRNADLIDPATVTVVKQPDCGSALVVGNVIRYSATAACDGAVVLTYCVPFEGACEVVPVTLTVLDVAERRPVAAASPDGSPQAAQNVQQGQAPDSGQDEYAMRQPARLTMPTNAEVITPSEATANIRSLNRGTSTGLAQSQERSTSGANVTVSRTSARSGSVSVVGAEMAQPVVVEDSAGITIAAATPRSTPAPGRSAPAVLAPRPGAPDTPSFRRPERVDAPSAGIVADSVSPSLPGLGSLPSDATATVQQDERDEPQQVAIAAPPEDEDTPAVLKPRIRGAGTPATSADGQDSDAGAAAAADPSTDSTTAETGQETQVAALPDDAGDTGAEEVIAAAPVVAIPEVSLGDVPVAGNAAPGLGQDREAEGETDLAALPPSDAPVTAGPEPEAQTTQPIASAAPQGDDGEDNSLISSLARSNTVIGATISAAEALFGPRSLDEADRTVTVEATSAPRPREARTIADLGIDTAAIEQTAGQLTLGEDRTPALDIPAIVVAQIGEAEVTPYERRTEQAMTPLQLLLGIGVERTADPAAASARLASTDLGTDVAGLSDTADSGPAAAGVTDFAVDDAIGADAGLDPLAALTGGDTGIFTSDAPRARPPQVLPAALELPSPVAGRAPAGCEINLALRVQIGAEIVGSLSSPCRPSQTFLVEHEGLAFSAETDGDGVANFIVPALQADAIVRVSFPDGGSEVDRATVEAMSRMWRTAVVWNEPINVDLRAFETGVAAAGNRLVSREEAGNYRLARRAGGGYLTVLGPLDGSGVQAVVYTLFKTLKTRPGQIDFELTLADARPGVCPTAPVIRIVESGQAQVRATSDLAIERGSTCSNLSVRGTDLGISGINVATVN